MLQMAIPNKGALSESAVTLLKEAGYRCSRYGRELIVSDHDNEIDFVFLFPVLPPTIAPTPPNNKPPAIARPVPPLVTELPSSNNSNAIMSLNE